MCLSSKTNWCKKKEGYGWKAFKKINGVLYPELRIEDFTNGLKINRWLIAKNKTIFMDDYFESAYKSGFHIFKTRREAREWKNYGVNLELIIKKVKYKGLICSGEQGDDYNIIVAKKMLIIK